MTAHSAAQPVSATAAPVTLGGRALLPPAPAAAAERRHAGARWTGIEDVDALPPFFTTAVGGNECWLFAGSNGPLCAGRRDPDGSLFPYVNVDRILEHPRSGGFLTAVLIEEAGGRRLWEPWSEQPALHPRRRSLFRHEQGAGLLFEERDLGSGLVLSAEVATCQRFGLVRRVTLANRGDGRRRVRLLDGWHRLLPPGLGADAFRDWSYLAQAYMRHERAPGAWAMLATMNAGLTDRAEPREVLRCAAAWCAGAAPRALLLSTRQVEAFRRGAAVEDEHEVRGATGALLAEFACELAPGEEARWTFGADTGLDQAAAGALLAAVARPDAAAEADRALAEDRAALAGRLAACDAPSLTGDAADDDAHRSSTLFNLMRGGALDARMTVDREAFRAWLARRNAAVAARAAAAIDAWPASLDLPGLAAAAGEAGDPQLERLAAAYLPLSFSRRHGDPSRPWNRFSIRLFDEQGRPVSAWQGNWRDIFQNWEALSLSFPAALPAMIATFLDASTADGYNPYRVTSEGVDWEVPEPGPWSHFGYWGDHQIVYLTRLLELAEAHHPGWIAARLGRRAHACADVPYRIAGYDALLADPRHAVSFDHARQEAVLARDRAVGSDGRLLPGPDGAPLLLSMAEKLLIPVLAKLSNLVPGAGIWLNTQRPEWNDANNALVGWGCSVVTLFQLRRHAVLLRRHCTDGAAWPVTAATAELLGAVAAALPACGPTACTGDAARRAAMDALGRAGERHRARVYAGDLGPCADLPARRVGAFLDAAIAALDASLAASRRADGLFHSYNVIHVAPGAVAVQHLDLMLEGQVAALASGWLGAEAAADLLRRLAASALWCAKRRTYLLYPDRAITPFLQRNLLPADARIALFDELAARGDRRLAVRDGGRWRFAADLANARELGERLDRLAGEPALAAAVARDRAAVLAAWEEVFGHAGYLGRSTTMFAFEGLGSVYWHMVSKLHLAALEAQAAASGGAAADLADAARAVRAGLGPARTPAEFGAFPCDPYSHTPAHAGAQQPGMTGQVKEEIVGRRVRLGIEVADGRLAFRPRLLRRADLLAEPGELACIGVDGRVQRVAVPAGGLAATVCQVPVVYRAAASPAITVVAADGACRRVAGDRLPPEISQEVFHRSGVVARIEVDIVLAGA